MSTAAHVLKQSKYQPGHRNISWPDQGEPGQIFLQPQAQKPCPVNWVRWSWFSSRSLTMATKCRGTDLTMARTATLCLTTSDRRSINGSICHIFTFMIKTYYYTITY